MKDVLKAWKNVFGKFNYLALALISGFVFFAFNAIIGNIGVVKEFYIKYGFAEGSKFLFNLVFGFWHVINKTSYISLVLTSIMFGMLVSMIFFKVNSNVRVRKRNSITSVVGVGLAAFVPGCAACGVGLASVLGLSSGFLI